VVLFRRDFGENATSGQAICITGIDAKAFILLANASASPTASETHTVGFRPLLRTRNMSGRRFNPPTVLTIAGSDSGGGAGIQADLHTFAAHGVHGLCAITAVTAQNTRSVAAIQPLSPRMVRAQLDAVFADFRVRVVKIGMLATPGIVRAVAAELQRRPRLQVVLDPVLVATTGARLASGNLVGPLRRHLLARSDLLTPNIPEAESLLGRRLRDTAGMLGAAADLIDLGARAVLLKGGHLTGRRVSDLLLTRDGAHWFHHARLRGEGHGTGCTLASAVAANLALGDSLTVAVGKAVTYVHRALAGGYRPGRGRLRVLDHLIGFRSRELP
jgi:hydroxymethylpyrimidine/phosphomethylpyrimidine kinase